MVKKKNHHFSSVSLARFAKEAAYRLAIIPCLAFPSTKGVLVRD